MSGLIWNVDRLSQEDLTKLQQDYVNEALEMARRGNVITNPLESLQPPQQLSEAIEDAQSIRDIISNNSGAGIKISPEGISFENGGETETSEAETSTDTRADLRKLIEERIGSISTNDNLERTEELFNLRKVIQDEMASMAQGSKEVAEMYDLKSVIENEIEQMGRLISGVPDTLPDIAYTTPKTAAAEVTTAKPPETPVTLPAPIPQPDDCDSCVIVNSGKPIFDQMPTTLPQVENNQAQSCPKNTTNKRADIRHNKQCNCNTKKN